MSIEEILRAMASGVDEAPTILPEAAIERLREAHSRIVAEIPFKSGDIVTIRKDAPLKGAGKPHLVTDVNPDGFPAGEIIPGDWSCAAKYTVRFIWVSNEHIVPHQAPHWMLEHFYKG